jgi:hypothetical protein
VRERAAASLAQPLALVSRRVPADAAAFQLARACLRAGVESAAGISLEE